MRDGAAPHQVDQDGREPGLHDVSAEQHDDAALFAYGVHDRVGHGEEAFGFQDLRERIDERAERTIAHRRAGEVFGADLVTPTGDRDRADFREVGFGRASGVC